MVFNARLAQANLVTKTDFDVKIKNLNEKINSNIFMILVLIFGLLQMIKY